MRAGTIGQLKGPFQAGQNVFSSLFAQEGTNSEKMKFGVSINEKDLMPFGNLSSYPNGLAFNVATPIGTVLVQMGRTCMYETDGAVQVNSLSFINNTPQSVIINYVIY